MDLSKEKEKIDAKKSDQVRKKVFTSDYVLDLKVYQEFAKGYQSLSIKKIIFYTIVLLGCILNIIYKNYTIVIVFGFLWLFYILLFLFNGKTKIQYNRMLSCNHGKPVHNTIVIDDKEILGSNENGNKSTYSFEQIIGIIETKNLLILKMKYNLGIIIDKNTLTGGTKEEFLDYLYSVCLNLKKKKVIRAKISSCFLILYTILLFLVFFLAIFLNILSDKYMEGLKTKLENANYSVIEMTSSYGNKEINILEVSKNFNHFNAYIYAFLDKQDAKVNFEYWSFLNKEEGSLENRKNCSSEKNYQKCMIEKEDTSVVLIQKDRYVFYGEIPLEYKEEIEELLNLLNDLKK